MIRTPPDGDTIEVRGSSNGNHPDADPRLQHTNASTVWFRINGGAWERCGGRSMHKYVEAMECADSVAEFRELLEIL